jgi:glycosyltransferase involved in cell wall biosynthesis
MISPLFPPIGVIGAKRSLLFARHLPRFGWTPAVVALPATMERDPALDRLVPQVPIWRGFRGGPLAWAEDLFKRGPSAHPYRATTSRGSEGALDRYTRYLPWAFAGAWGLLRRTRCEAIYVNAGPHSGQVLGSWLAAVTGLPLVLDLRDPWSIEPNYRVARTARANRRVEELERRFFTRAARIILNTQSAERAYRAAYAGVIPPERFLTIRSAFDPELYGSAPAPPVATGPLEIVYFGHLRPQKNAGLFLEGFARFIAEQRLAPGEAMLTTLGTRTAADEESIARLGLLGFTRTHPWVSFPESRALLGRSDLLLDLMGPAHGLQISGKVFDYLAANRPILSVTPNEEMGAILTETRTGERVDLDAAAIAAALARALAAKRAGRPFEPDRTALRRFEAEPAAAALGAVLDEVTR